MKLKSLKESLKETKKEQKINLSTWILMVNICKFDKTIIDPCVCFTCGLRSDNMFDISLHNLTHHGFW